MINIADLEKKYFFREFRAYCVWNNTLTLKAWTAFRFKTETDTYTERQAIAIWTNTFNFPCLIIIVISLSCVRQVFSSTVHRKYLACTSNQFLAARARWQGASFWNYQSLLGWYGGTSIDAKGQEAIQRIRQKSMMSSGWTIPKLMNTIHAFMELLPAYTVSFWQLLSTFHSFYERYRTLPTSWNRW